MKNQTTLDLEYYIWEKTNKIGTFGCFEVTIGFGGKERVDYLTYDTKGIWRCYEIKSSKEDFFSNNALTFVGNYNYFVMPAELYDDVQDCIPSGIGVYTELGCERKSRQRTLGIDEDVLKDSMLRSLYRYAQNVYKSKGAKNSSQQRVKITNLEQANRILHSEIDDLKMEIRVRKHCDRESIKFNSELYDESNCKYISEGVRNPYI